MHPNLIETPRADENEAEWQIIVKEFSIPLPAAIGASPFKLFGMTDKDWQRLFGLLNDDLKNELKYLKSFHQKFDSYTYTKTSWKQNYNDRLPQQLTEAKDRLQVSGKASVGSVKMGNNIFLSVESSVTEDTSGTKGRKKFVAEIHILPVQAHHPEMRGLKYTHSRILEFHFEQAFPNTVSDRPPALSLSTDASNQQPLGSHSSGAVAHQTASLFTARTEPDGSYCGGQSILPGPSFSLLTQEPSGQ
jgi:hypothetical protein